MFYKKLKNAPLIYKCTERDPLAWAEFVRRYSPFITFSLKKAIYRYSGRPQKDGEIIKDLMQNIFMNLWNKNGLNDVRNRENINFWLAITARNAVVNYLESDHREVLMEDVSYFDSVPAKEKEERRKIPEALVREIYNSMPHRHRLIFRFYFTKGLPLKKISHILGIPAGSVSSVISRIRKKLNHGRR